MSVTPGDLISDAARKGPASFFEQPEHPELIYNFDQGLAARETFPEADLTRLANKVLKDDLFTLDYFAPEVGYGELTHGSKRLRELIAERIAKLQGKTVPANGLILTSGSVQAIALAARAFVDPGDVVAIEAVTFPYGARYMREAGADLLPIPIDWSGMDVDALEVEIARLESEGKRLKLAYLGPTFHCPTGAVMSLERRKKLVALAQKHRFMVLEDDCYGELRFDGEPLPSLFSLDDQGFVMQAGTFSKTIAPALRLGWMAGTPEVIEALASVRQDLGVSQWLARVMVEYLSEGLYDPHLTKVREVYRQKCMAAVEGLKAAGNLVRFDIPQGSFYLWVEIDESVDWPRAQALAAEQKIYFRPGERFLSGDQKRRFFRMSYSQEPLERVREGCAKVGAIISECAKVNA